MSSVEDTEVFIPQQARVVTVPARLLPSSVTKKMPLSPAHSDRPATFISPVELRIKGTTRKPRPLTPGQFFLPVLTSNSEAFKILQDFLLSGQTSLQVSESSGARSAFCRRRNSIVLFNKQIFLIVRKAKEPDWPLEGQSTSLSKCEAPPLSSPVKTQDGGSAITEGRSKEDGREAEDDGVMECEALDDDITDRKRSTDGTDGSAPESSLATAEYCKRVTFSRVQSPSVTSENGHQGKSDSKGQMSELEITQDKSEASVRAAEVVEVNIAHRAAQENAGDANEDGVKFKPYISIQTSKGQSSHCECADETVNISSEHNVASGGGNAVGTNSGKFEHLLEMVEILKQGINDGVNDQASSVGFEKCQKDDIAMEMGAERDDLIGEKRCAEVESVTAGSHMEVIEVNERSANDDPDRPVSGDGSHVNKTGAKTKREGPVSAIANSSGEAKGCEGSAQISDTADSDALHRSTNDTNRDVTSSKSCADVKCPSVTLKHCEIVDDDDDDENDAESGNALGPQTGDGAKGCKRKIFTRIADETSLDLAAVARNSGNNISSAKRCKRDDDDDDVEFLSESKPAVKHRHKAKNHDHDVVIIEDDDNEDDKINRSSNSTNEMSSLSVSSLDECDLEILDVRGCQGDDVELQSILEKIKSRKRRVSDSEDVEVCTESHISETEDLSTKRFKTEDATNSGAKTGGKSVGASDQGDQINNTTPSDACRGEAERLLTRNDVEILTTHNSDEVSRESENDPINAGTDYSTAAAGPISVVENSSSANKVRKTASEIKDTHEEDRANEANGVDTDCVESCVKSQVSEVQRQSAEQERVTSDEQNVTDVTNGGVCGDSHVSEEDQSAAHRHDFTAKSVSEEPNREGTSRDLSAHGANDDDAAQKEDEDLDPAGLRDTPTPDVAASRGFAAPQTGESSSEKRERHVSDPERQPSGPDRDGKLAEEHSARDQSARAEEAAVMPRPTSPFTELRREENISRIRAKIRGMEEKLNKLINSHPAKRERSGNVSDQ